MTEGLLYRPSGAPKARPKCSSPADGKALSFGGGSAMCSLKYRLTLAPLLG